MNRHDRRDRHHRHRRFLPSADVLETRQLPSISGFFGNSYSSNQVYYQAQIVRHQYDEYVSELKRLELASQATTTELLALRNDARSISAAASTSTLPHSAAQDKAVEISLQLDRSPLYGSLGDDGWSGIASTLTADASGLNVPQSLISQTVTDMRALATSAGVDPFGFATFTSDFVNLQNAEWSLPSNSGYHFEDPSLYYTQHLRGFFRGFGVQKLSAQAKLKDDLRDIQQESRTDPAGAAVLGRDVGILRRVSAAVPSTTNQQFDDAYLAAFAQGAPGPAIVPQLQSNLVTTLGPFGTASLVRSVDRLADDAPAFYRAAGASLANIQTIVTDVAALADVGGGQTLNPFRITIAPGRAG